MMRQGFGSSQAAFDDRVEPDLFGVSDTGIEIMEDPPLVEVGNMNGVTRPPHFVCEREDTGREPLRVVEQQYLSHIPFPSLRQSPCSHCYHGEAVRSSGQSHLDSQDERGLSLAIRCFGRSWTNRIPI